MLDMLGNGKHGWKSVHSVDYRLYEHVDVTICSTERLDALWNQEDASQVRKMGRELMTFFSLMILFLHDDTPYMKSCSLMHIAQQQNSLTVTRRIFDFHFVNFGPV